LFFATVSSTSVDGVPGYPQTTLTPALIAPKAMASFPINSFFKTTSPFRRSFHTAGEKTKRPPMYKNTRTDVNLRYHLA
jgi:hypothetical protein